MGILFQLVEVVLRPENIKYLKQNGIIIYIDRPIDNILTDVHKSSFVKRGPTETI